MFVSSTKAGPDHVAGEARGGPPCGLCVDASKRKCMIDTHAVVYTIPYEV
jgi:hypothetical protein